MRLDQADLSARCLVRDLGTVSRCGSFGVMNSLRSYVFFLSDGSLYI